jgi:hypothetical protein
MAGQTVCVSSKNVLGKTARLAFAAALFAAAVVSVPAPQAAATTSIPGIWSVTGSMSRARGFAPAVKLADGSVITAGGTDGLSFTATAERWSPSGLTWTAAGSIGQALAGGSAALLPSGKALFAGGAGDAGYYGYGDLYDATANSWTRTPAMAHVHAYDASAQLSNGNVLVIAGMDGGDAFTTNAVDIYSASGNSWSAGQSLPGAGRYALTATTLKNGTILAAGGDDGTSAGTAAMSSVAIYTDGSGWATAESMKVARFDHAAVRLSDGKILVAGGSDATGAALASAEIYDPATGHWTLTGSMGTARYGLTLTLMNNGYVLAAGGYSSSSSPALNTAEVYDPTAGVWTPTGSMLYGRRYQSATLLNDGSVLVAGGRASDSDYFQTTAEIYTPPLVYPPTTFHALTPKRILDTRYNLGLTGKFSNKSSRLLTVVNQGGVPPTAIAVTGIVTVTNQTAGGYVAVGPVPTNAPTVSTLNFPYDDNRANNVTVALDTQGRLSFVLVAPDGTTTDILFDVTGYFTADDTGATFFPITPVRVMDSRNGAGLTAPGAYPTKTIKSTTVWGAGGGAVPTGAIAVTGNLTVVAPTSLGWAFAGPAIPPDVVSLNCSMVNAGAGETKADGVTVKLTDTGALSFVWDGERGSTAQMIFDVTGYFMSGTSGARFVPMSPIRVADTRIGLPSYGPVKEAAWVKVPIVGRGSVPATATGMTGNLTVTSQTDLGYLSVVPVGTKTAPPTSTLNFPVDDNRANGFSVSLAPDGSIAVGYWAVSGSTTQFVVDLTGYYLHATP